MGTHDGDARWGRTKSAGKRGDESEEDGGGVGRELVWELAGETAESEGAMGEREEERTRRTRAHSTPTQPSQYQWVWWRVSGLLSERRRTEAHRLSSDPPHADNATRRTARARCKHAKTGSLSACVGCAEQTNQQIDGRRETTQPWRPTRTLVRDVSVGGVWLSARGRSDHRSTQQATALQNHFRTTSGRGHKRQAGYDKRTNARRERTTKTHDR